jgi:hypothetical protein
MGNREIFGKFALNIYELMFTNFVALYINFLPKLKT